MPPMIDQAGFRKAVSHLGSAICIVTTAGDGGMAGFTASSVCSLSDDPPMLLVCLQRKSSAYHAVKSNGRVCVNTVGADGLALVATFSGKTPMDERFDSADWRFSAQGSPILSKSMISFDCEITDYKTVVTHDILVCAVREIVCGNMDQAALIYYNRDFHELATARGK